MYCVKKNLFILRLDCGSKSQVLRFQTGVGGDMEAISNNNDGVKSILNHENEEKTNEQISEVMA